ncbi:MAG: hypothetical protein ACK4N5_25580, partial [Myxococcales bacterium]
MNRVLPLITLLLLGADAHAQATTAATSFDVQHFKPSADAEAFFTVDQAEVEAHKSFDLALSFNFVKSPLVLVRRSDGAQVGAFVDRRLDLNVLASVGLFGF